MGIPAYYKKLSKSVHGLIARGHPSAAIHWLFMDFNCLIYHCLPKMPPYLRADHEAWEAALIECVVRDTRRVVGEVAPEKGVLIAIDGVVPMAKMRQQRLRRFKAVWERATASTGGAAADHWNSNAITPGTAFMGKLRRGLEAAKGAGWTISSSDEPGEGEHKIMAAWRTGAYDGNFAVYGLDADLIVLSLLGREQRANHVWLFREEVVGGTIQKDAAGLERFEWFAVHALADWIRGVGAGKEGAVYDYCFAMSVLGNDFLPSSLGLKMRDDGHHVLLEALAAAPRLINETMEISAEGLAWLVEYLGRSEEQRTDRAIHRKSQMALGLVATVGESDWPVAVMEERCLFERGRIAKDWRRRYARAFFTGHSTARIAREYLVGIQWIWAYYTGQEVCYNWFFPHTLPPLWPWVAKELKGELPPLSVHLRATDIRPVEQLALVLPLESWDLIPVEAKAERAFPLRAPQYFPTTYGFDSVGKRFFWECEPRIPVPSMLEFKALVGLRPL
jgi:5'-3' exonuclease